MKSLTVSPTSVAGGARATCAVVLSAAAPSGGLTINISSSNAAVQVPSSTVTIPAGHNSLAYIVTTSGVTTTTTATLSASGGGGTATATLSVLAPSITSVTFKPTTVNGGVSVYGTVTVSANAPAGGLSVALSSNSASAVPQSSVTIRAGEHDAPFIVATHPVSKSVVTEITAKIPGSSKYGELGIRAPSLNKLSISPASVTGGATARVIVTISCPAPTGGSAVALSSASSSVTVPTTVTVPAGEVSGATWITTSPVSTSTTVQITGTLTASQHATIKVVPPVLTGLSLETSTVIGGAGNSTGVVKLGSLAPTGGLTVTLSSNSTYAAVPASVIVAAGHDSATFLVTSSAVATNSQAKISATFGSTTLNATLTVNAATLDGVFFSYSSIQGGTLGLGSVGLDGPAPTGGVTVTLSSNQPYAKVPATVAVAAGARRGWFTIESTGVLTSSTATIQGTFNGTTLSGTLTLTTGWPSLRGTYTGNGRNGGPANTTVTEAWTFSPAGGLSFTSAGAAMGSDGTLYLGVTGGLVAVGPTGSQSWLFSSPDTGDGTATPAIGPDGTIYYGTSKGDVYAVTSSGTLKWTFVAGGEVSSSPVLGADGTVYVGSDNDDVYAIDPATGAQKWMFATEGAVTSSPAIGSDGSVYVGSSDGSLYSISSAGAKNWSYSTGGAVVSSPAIGSDGSIYFGSNDRNFYALTSAGAKKWSVTTVSAVDSSPAIGQDGNVYVGLNQFGVTALDAATGDQVWVASTSGRVESSPAVGSDGAVYFGCNDGNVYAATSGGGTQWVFTLPSAVTTSPIIGPDGSVYIAQAGVLYKLAQS